ncbi:MAG: DUF664 domain-containing protein [Treponema sp.]|jgi:uncharacterized damage-inducible protein DinB|nr:DUF664 domain-containing protein [Treponema sp.]
MNDVLMYARYNQAGNKAIYGILSKLDNDEREKDRGSYYGSLSGLLRHVIGGTRFFLGLFKSALASNPAAVKVVESLDAFPQLGEGQLTAAQWKETAAVLDTVDAAYVELAGVLAAKDLAAEVKLDWYGGNPAAVPLSFMLSQLLVHNSHHRGQISQILDSLKIDNDYSGIDVSLLK